MKFLDSDIIKILQENENCFCSGWHSKVVNFKNKFFIMYTKELSDDYFLNRTLINENLDFNLFDHIEIEKTIHDLTEISNAKKITLYLNIPSKQSLLEEYLIKENFEKIDEVIGLQYHNHIDYGLSPLDTDILVKPFNGNQKILIVDSYDELKMWVKAYCTIFEINREKEDLIYKILRNRFNVFDFVLFKINVKDKMSSLP